MGLLVKSAQHFNTDVFGSFCHTFERTHSALDTCIEKAKIFSSDSGHNLVLASEGSFGPHPHVPWVACNEELMVFWDAKQELLISESVVSMKTNYASEVVSGYSNSELRQLLAKILFPSHAVMLFDEQNNQLIAKGIQKYKDLYILLKRYPRARIATDMRANLNPTRQQNILEVAKRLIERLNAFCPACDTPGFGKKRPIGNKLCPICGFETRYPDRMREYCITCDFFSDTVLEQKTDQITVHCDWCNP